MNILKNALLIFIVSSSISFCSSLKISGELENCDLKSNQITLKHPVFEIEDPEDKIPKNILRAKEQLWALDIGGREIGIGNLQNKINPMGAQKFDQWISKPENQALWKQLDRDCGIFE